MDSASRRAFPLDSRSVWIEQQIKHQVLLPRDNLCLGPGEYHTIVPERHVSSPVLGKYRGPADHFRNFRSTNTLRSERLQEQYERSTVSRETKRNHSNENVSKSTESLEFSTIFHEYDKRQALDPKTHFTQTPGAYLGPDTPYEVVRENGKDVLKTTLDYNHSNLPFGERCPTKAALPTYDVNYDSQQIRKSITLGSFPKNSRITIPKKGEKAYPSDESAVGTTCSSYQHRSNHTPEPPHNMNVFQHRLSLVALPKVKTRAPPAIIFDDSSYRKNRKPFEVTPQLLNRQAKVHLFDQIVAIPRTHKSAEFRSPKKFNSLT